MLCSKPDGLLYLVLAVRAVALGGEGAPVACLSQTLLSVVVQRLETTIYSREGVNAGGEPARDMV
jgi:hypothetical protein